MASVRSFAQTAKPLAAAYGEFAVSASAMPVGELSRTRVCNAFIDTVGVGLAGRSQEVSRILSRQFGIENDIWLSADRAGARTGEIALCNAAAAHALDYDDVAQHGHPSVVLVPAILAQGQASGANGRDALRAYLVGYEIWCDLACREADSYHLKSWHPTAMLGTMAATAALASLSKLDAEQAAHALALSASFAGGINANFGSHAKALQVGRAAANAIEAVSYASRGITASAEAIDVGNGFLAAISPHGRVDLDTPFAVPSGPDDWAICRNGLSVKRYPVCYASHRAIDATIELAKTHDILPTDVQRVVVSMGKAPAATLRFSHPSNATEARFSLSFAIAAALIDHAVGFRQLDDAFVTRTDVRGLYPLVDVAIVSDECPEQPGLARHDRVCIETRDGATYDSGPIRFAQGHAKRPMSDEALEAKFRDCARFAGVDDAEALLARLRQLDELQDLGTIAT